MTEGAPLQPRLERIIYENAHKEPVKRKYSYDNPEWRQKVYQTGYVLPCSQDGQWTVKKYDIN